MKTLNPNNCLKCPFMYIDYDDFSVGYSVMYVCTLSQFNNNENYIINYQIIMLTKSTHQNGVLLKMV